MAELPRLSFGICATILLFFCAGQVADAEVSSQIEKGKELFEKRCSMCHTVGGGKKVGPDLQGATKRRDRQWLIDWISDPGKMIRTGDKTAVSLAKEFGNLRMPTLGLSQEEILAVLAYLDSKEVQRLGPPEVPIRRQGGKPEVYFLSETYLQAYQDERGKRYAPVYEHLLLELESGDRKLGFHSSGWVDYDLRSLRTSRRETDELTYAFLRYSPLADNRLTADLGRNLVFEGVASEQIDGLSVRWEVTENTGFSAFGGVPVETEFDSRTGDLIFGGRVFQRLARKLELGLSYLRENNDGSRYREEAGIDIWILPIKKLEFQGHSFLNLATDGWMEHSYSLRWFFLPRLTLTGLFLHTNYDDAFSARTLNVFSPEFLGKGEELTKTGVRAEYRWNRNLTAVADLSEYSYEQSGSALYYGAGIRGTVYGILSGIEFHRMDGDTERLRYTELRAYAKTTLRRFVVSADALIIHYDKAFSGLNNVYSVTGAVSCPITKTLTAGLSVDYSKNPDFTGDTMALFKVAYNLRR